MATFTERMKEQRKAKDMNQRELAQRLHVSPGAVAMYETARREPSFATIVALANIFGVSVDYLLCRTDIPATAMPAKPVYPLSPPPPVENPVLAEMIEHMIEEKGFHDAPRIVLYTFGALTVEEIERLRCGASPVSFPEERLVRFFRKFPLDKVRAYYRTAGVMLPQAFQDLEIELRELLDRVCMSTDGSPEALEYVLQLAHEVFEKR